MSSGSDSMRFGDDEHCPFGQRTIWMKVDGRDIVYRMDFDDADQDEVPISIGEYRAKIYIQHKSVDHRGIYTISGEIEYKSDRIIAGSGHWCEVILSPRAIANYWGSAVIDRSDWEVVLEDA